MAKRLDHYWYSRNGVSTLLLPLSWVFRAIAALRRWVYHVGIKKSARLPVPVIVVGNITVGGSGKTPLVIHIVQLLRQAGYRPGIISRGYGGQAKHWPQQVRGDSDPSVVGDEAVLLARRCQCPMAVGPDRVAAGHALLRHTDVNVIVTDDGLQHYALQRDIEIAVLDGQRGLGNGRFLPAGPLRESRHRLESVDIIVNNGQTASERGYLMTLSDPVAHNLRSRQQTCELTEFAGSSVHAVAGIGNPQRFFDLLQGLGIKTIAHAFADHHAYRAQDLDFNDALPVLMTEKDAVKCQRFAQAHWWQVSVESHLEKAFNERLLNLLARTLHGQKTA